MTDIREVGEALRGSSEYRLPDEVVSIGAFTGRIDRLTWLSGLLLTLACLGAAEVTRLPQVQWAPWIVGMALLTLPHGGMDDAIPSILRGEGLFRRPRAWFYIGYVGILASVLLLWKINADLGLISFLLFSGFHFGQGDLYWIHQRRRQQRRRESALEGWDRGTRFVLTMVRGALPVFLPFIFHDQEFLEIGRRLEESAGQRIWMPVWISEHRALLLFLLGLTVAVQVGDALRRYLNGRRSGQIRHSVLREIPETLLLIGWLIAAPPILSIGAYLLCWHAPRHICRLILLDPGMKKHVVGGHPFGAIVEFHRRSLALVIAALVIFLVIAILCVRYRYSAEHLVLPAFLFVNAITVPHVLMVTILDRFQGVWKKEGSGELVSAGEAH